MEQKPSIGLKIIIWISGLLIGLTLPYATAYLGFFATYYIPVGEPGLHSDYLTQFMLYPFLVVAAVLTIIGAFSWRRATSFHRGLAVGGGLCLSLGLFTVTFARFVES